MAIVAHKRNERSSPLLQNRLVLHRFVCRQFGYDDLGGMLERLLDVPVGIGTGGASEYAQALYLNPDRASLTRDQLEKYDGNIAAHSVRLRMTGEHGRTWKPHQYLALLFTEHYLRRYFGDPTGLLADLNEARAAHQATAGMPDYQTNDLRTLAFQSATGSGKTLLMHVHILQYRHYLRGAGGRLNNIVLVTPNEQLSAQHERDLPESGLQARIFSSKAGGDVFFPVEIIDLNKLAEKKGIKRVAVGDFGDDNLVLVDEGHLGASGRVWRERRRELARGGFSFEYSATFNQVVGKDAELRDAYGKCLLFDYPYRRFHADGYGKDYAILNLPAGVQDENSDMYLLGCLLTFYQQCRIWRDKGAGWTEFNLAKPLWVFLGKTVTGSSKSKADQATRSDVIQILNFLGWALAHGGQARSMIRGLLNGQSGLLDEAGRDYFAGRFPYLDGEDIDGLYDDLCEAIFHGAGQLHVVYLTAGDGELHLCTADNDVFGVVNVGDSAKLYKLLTEQGNPALKIEREMGFAERLFAHVDRTDSTVNVVIGARRFIAGWNSWRVSTMGLMHVGVGEGPEIIQMFGRGVRLKGWNMSLKRHGESRVEPPRDSAELAELEKLYIFGLKANYMQTFRQLLAKEGMRSEQVTQRLDLTWNFSRKTGLKLIRLRENRKFGISGERPVLPEPDAAGAPFVTLDLYSRLQSVVSEDAAEGGASGAGKESATLSDYAGFFDMERVYDRVLLRKRQEGWGNLVIGRGTVSKLLQSADWYQLYVPPERLSAGAFRPIRALEDVAIDLITAYADEFWRKHRRKREHGHIEVVTLDQDDPNNFGAYELSMNASKGQPVRDADEATYGQWGIDPIRTRFHAYEPLLHAREGCEVTIRPVALDGNERKVVEGLSDLAEEQDSCLQGRELFLIRNLTRGRGISFFDDFDYYPDFIVWLKDARSQHLIFLDPKGLSRFGPRERKKVQLHHEIREIEQQLRAAHPELRLHSCILSVTAPQDIGAEPRSKEKWARDGVYFLHDPDCLRQVISRVLQSSPFPVRATGGPHKSMARHSSAT